MAALFLHDFHSALGAGFTFLNGVEAVDSYGPVEKEYHALTSGAALVDLSFRSRICLLGTDRDKFLHGQVTNEILHLKVGEGVFAALVTAKGKLQTDLFAYKLQEELLLDFEPGLTQSVTERLQKYIIAEDVQVVDVAPHYGLLSVQGPHAAETLRAAKLVSELPSKPLNWTKATSADGDLYVMNHSRYGTGGYDIFVPNAQLLSIATQLLQSIDPVGVAACEIARIENGIPRFGVDMDETNLAPEALSERAISYSKGCYIGQEVIARIRTYGQVAKALRLVRLPGDLKSLPAPRTKLFNGDKEVGYITSSTLSPKHGGMVGMAYVRKEANTPGQELQFAEPGGGTVQVVGRPEGGSS